MIEYKIIKDIENAYKLISRFETQLTPTLTERGIDIQKYSEKLIKYGIIIEMTYCGQTAGVFGGYVNDKVNHIAFASILVIDGEMRGLRLGGKLLLFAEETAIQNEMRFMKLEVRNFNDRAIRLYRNIGYSIIGDAGPDSYFMMKEIAKED